MNKTITLINKAAVILAISIVVIMFILVPERSWNIFTLISAFLFACSVAYILYVPSIFQPKEHTSDSQILAAIGPIGFLSALLVLITGGSFVLALLDYQKLSLALLVFAISSFLVINILINAALKVIGDVSKEDVKPSRHSDWENQVKILTHQTSHKESKSQMKILGNKLLYSPSDIREGSPYDIEIEQSLNKIENTLQSDPAIDLTTYINEINELVCNRDVFLRSARCKK